MPSLTGLFTNYGELGGVWFDGVRDKPDADWQIDRTYALLTDCNPALIVSNHHQLPLPGEDNQTFEKDLPGDNTTAWGGAPISSFCWRPTTPRIPVGRGVSTYATWSPRI